MESHAADVSDSSLKTAGSAPPTWGAAAEGIECDMALSNMPPVWTIRKYHKKFMLLDFVATPCWSLFNFLLLYVIFCLSIFHKMFALCFVVFEERPEAASTLLHFQVPWLQLSHDSYVCICLSNMRIPAQWWNAFLVVVLVTCQITHWLDQHQTAID